MGGINSLSGLNNVSVDFRPTITTNVQKTGNTNQLLPEANAAPEEAPQQMGQARSVVRELDVLLLNAAGKSVAADAEGNVKKASQSLRDMGVLTKRRPPSSIVSPRTRRRSSRRSTSSRAGTSPRR